MEALLSSLISLKTPLALVSILAYLVLCALVYQLNTRLAKEPVLNHKGRIKEETLPILLGGLVLISHLIFVFSIIMQVTDKGIAFNLGLVNIAALMGWLVTLITFSSNFFGPVLSLGLFSFPLSIVSILLAFIFPSKSQWINDLSGATLLHISLSLLAFSVLTIAAGQSLFVAALDYRLKHKVTTPSKLGLPPLQTLEATLFGTTGLALTLLTLSILSGFFHLEDLFAQDVAHKTILSILAWIVLTALMAGRFFFGWRGSRAIKLILSAYVLLFVAFLGSKFVLEILLERT